ncbi:hypothetical protein RIR_jg17612.t1 [Rhizophagus irregularis DAOM 181602=DAOM 197198]|nr:hypothetical protein RIR_jg17612.t1 [Rhizophagus irregularis DAOM 181602=DAOM 197198]
MYSPFHILVGSCTLVEWLQAMDCKRFSIGEVRLHLWSIPSPPMKVGLGLKAIITFICLFLNRPVIHMTNFSSMSSFLNANYRLSRLTES